MILDTADAGASAVKDAAAAEIKAAEAIKAAADERIEKANQVASNTGSTAFLDSMGQ